MSPLFTADGDEIRAKGSTVSGAAETAGSALSATVDRAGESSAGFPGESSAAFDSVLRKLSRDDSRMTRRATEVAEYMRENADAFDATDSANSDRVTLHR